MTISLVCQAQPLTEHSPVMHTRCVVPFKHGATPISRSLPKINSLETPRACWNTKSNGIINCRNNKKHTAPGIRWSSPTQLLIQRLQAWLWESGRDPVFSCIYGRMCLVYGELWIISGVWMTHGTGEDGKGNVTGISLQTSWTIEKRKFILFYTNLLQFCDTFAG